MDKSIAEIVHDKISDNYSTKNHSLYEFSNKLMVEVINILKIRNDFIHRKELMNLLIEKDIIDKTFDPATFRKLIQIYRERAFDDIFTKNGYGIIIANSKGYSFSADIDDIQEYRATLTKRRTSLSKQDLSMEIIINELSKNNDDKNFIDDIKIGSYTTKATRSNRFLMKQKMLNDVMKFKYK